MKSKFSPKLESEEIKNKILEFHSSGMNAVDIAKEVGVTPPSIRNFLKRNNLNLNVKFGHSKNSPKITPEKEKIILKMHKKGHSNVEIGNKIGVSNTAIRIFLNKKGLKSNDGSIYRAKKCLCCNVKYNPIRGLKGYNTYSFCSKECSSKYIEENKGKYSKEDIERVVELKKQLNTNKDIERITGVNINKIKEIIKEKKLFLTPEEKQQNAYNKKIEKNPNAMALLRESRMQVDCEEYEKRLLNLKKHLEENGGTATGDAEKFGVNPSSVVLCFHRRGWSNLISAADSAPQRELERFVREICGDNEEILYSTRKIIPPLELDIYIPSKRFAIEYNGLYWHSSKSPSWKEERHFTKFKICEKNNIKLLAIFEDEWKNPVKKQLIKEMIKYRLGLSSSKSVRASSLKLTIRTKNEEFKDFFDKFHIDGHTNAKYSICLENEKGEILSAISIRKNFNREMEIARFATNYNYIVHGAFQKLIKEAPRPIVSFSNNRLSFGDIYIKNGFKLVSENKPSYWYTDFETRVWRFKCKRINDPEILEKYPTEEIQALNGIFSKKIFGDDRPMWKIEDYGHKKWILN